MKEENRLGMSQNSLQDKVWQSLEKFAEKKVRQEKVGYLQLLKICQRKEGIIKEVMENLERFIEEEKKKGYKEEDIHLWCVLSTHDGWYTWVSLKYENKLSGKSDYSCSPFSLDYDIKCETKEIFEETKELERKFKEEEKKAREFLSKELENIEFLRQENTRLKEEIQELKKVEEEDEDEF